MVCQCTTYEVVSNSYHVSKAEAQLMHHPSCSVRNEWKSIQSSRSRIWYSSFNTSSSKPYLCSTELEIVVTDNAGSLIRAVTASSQVSSMREFQQSLFIPSLKESFLPGCVDSNLWDHFASLQFFFFISFYFTGYYQSKFTEAERNLIILKCLCGQLNADHE